MTVSEMRFVAGITTLLAAVVGASEFEVAVDGSAEIPEIDKTWRRRKPPPPIELWVESKVPATQGALDAADAMMARLEKEMRDQTKVQAAMPLVDKMSDEERALFMAMGPAEQEAHLAALAAAPEVVLTAS